MNVIIMGRKKYTASLLNWCMSNRINIIAVVTDSQFYNSETAIEAKRLGIPITSQDEAEEIVKGGGADLVVSYLYWKRIKEPLISTPKYGCINFHPAILPDWRGTAGYNVAILSKLKRWGATAHYVDNNFDTGNIIRVFDFSFDYRNETAYTLEKKTQSVQMDLFKSVMIDVVQYGILPSESQSKEIGTYISRQKMEEMKAINFDTDDIDLKIRAFWFPPYQGANIQVNNRKYTLINDEILASLSDGWNACGKLDI